MRVRRRCGLQAVQICWSRVAFLSEAICEALKTNSTLTSINLKSNHIGAEGGKARWCQVHKQRGLVAPKVRQQ